MGREAAAHATVCAESGAVKALLEAEALRQSMRAAGYRESKSCAVSEDWSATRYNPIA